jgi:hypothetical protein
MSHHQPRGAAASTPSCPRQIKQAGLLERRPWYYIWKKITVTTVTLAAGRAAFAVVGDWWWQLAVRCRPAAASLRRCRRREDQTDVHAPASRSWWRRAGGEADQPGEERGLAAEQVGELAAGQLGYSISQASASVMTEAVIGNTVRDAMDISAAFLELMQSRGRGRGDEDVLGDAVAFEGVARYPARIKCALLSWMASKDATARALDGTGHARDGEITAD